MTPGRSHPIPGVGVVVVEGGALLVVRRLHEPYPGTWAVPGGKVGWGETLREAAAREVLEETGLVVRVGAVVWAGETIGPGDPPAWHHTLVDLAGSVVGGKLMAGDDAGEARWVDLEEIEELPLAPIMRELVRILRESE